MKARPARIEPGPEQESVWDYPRPPRVEDSNKHIQVIFNGVTIADTRRAKRVLETAGAPVYYIPPEDVQRQYLEGTGRATFCEWKGQAAYYGLKVNDKRVENAGWCYPNPTPGFREIKDYVAFYCRPMDACLVDGEVARPQPGGFYGGWITDNVVGPFKGEPGSEGW
jgi:uncharacterized protein (DUF427 family)